MVAKILIVDDEPHLEIVIRQLFRKRIRKGELSFSFAAQGEEALAMLEEDPEIEVVFSDINMPVMNGLTLLKKINERCPLIRTVIITAYSDMKNIRAAMNHGAFDFLTKPINLEDLEITLAKTLEHVRELRALSHVRRRRYLVEQLHAMAGSVASSLELGLVRERFLEKLVAIFSLREAWLVRRREGSALQIAARWGEPGTRAEAADLPAEQLERLISEGAGELILGGDRIYCLPSSRPHAEPEWVLLFRETTLDDQERETARELTEEATPALENAHLFEEVRQLATTDRLTRLDNRRHFLERADMEIARAQRYGNPLVAIMLDIDTLESINELHGHGTGDRVLREVGEIVRGTCRKTDLAARYGDDEMVILLIETDMSLAADIADRLRKRVADQVLRDGSGEMVAVTVSLGVTSHAGHPEELAALLERARRLMLTAKERGRNRMEVA